MNKKIKQIITIITVTIVAAACGNSTKEVIADPTFTIDAKIDSLNYKMAYLAQWKDGGFVKSDSIAIQEGNFSFSGTVVSPNVHHILFDGSNERVLVFVENSNISIAGVNLKAENITVTGSAIHDQLSDFNEQTTEYNERLKIIVDEYHAAQQSGDEVMVAKIDAKYTSEDSLKKVFVEAYIKENSNSVIAPYLTLSYMMGKDLEGLEELNAGFSDSIRASEYVQQIEERITVLKSSAIGQAAPLFTMNDKDGNSIALESFKGNYVLIDFWASWCGPCRRENPNIVAAYKKYHDRGFEILGVSFDTSKEKWLKAIEKDELTWSHVSDLKGWANAAGKLYGIKGIPHSVLIDKEGIIVAKNLREETLHEKLEEIFGENS